VEETDDRGRPTLHDPAKTTDAASRRAHPLTAAGESCICAGSCWMEEARVGAKPLAVGSATQSQPDDRVVQLINPVLRGWVNYFAVGHASECFSFIRDWVEKKVRRHMGDPRNRRGSAGRDGVGGGLYDETEAV